MVHFSLCFSFFLWLVVVVNCVGRGRVGRTVNSEIGFVDPDLMNFFTTS